MESDKASVPNNESRCPSCKKYDTELKHVEDGDYYWKCKQCSYTWSTLRDKKDKKAVVRCYHCGKWVKPGKPCYG